MRSGRCWCGGCWRIWRSLVPVALLFFIPALICAGQIWSWWDIPVGVEAVLDKKRWYLSHGFFYLRFLIYFVGLSGVALALRRNSVGQDADGSPVRTLKMRKLGVAGIPILAFSLTFSAFDWLMGLDYKWGSTMWGVYIFAGAAGSSMSLLVLLVTWLRNKGYLQGVTVEHYHIMGKLMLAFCIFWAYIGFSQYMLIWYANIPGGNGVLHPAEHRLVAHAEYAAGGGTVLPAIAAAAAAMDEEDDAR